VNEAISASAQSGDRTCVRRPLMRASFSFYCWRFS